MGNTIRQLAADNLSPIRAIHSLSEVQASSIGTALLGLAPAWSIDRHESCDGHLSLLVSHTARDATLVVSRDAHGIQINLMLGDVLHTSTHRYPSVDATISALKVMARCNNTYPQRREA